MLGATRLRREIIVGIARPVVAAVVLALMATALLVVAGSASATILCKVKAAEEACPAEDIEPVPSSIEAELKEGTSAVFKGTIEAVCKKSAMKGETTKEVEGVSEPLLGTITSMTMTECSGCKTVEALNLPYKASIVPAEKLGDGVLTLESSEKGSPSFKMSGCSLGLSCTFGAKSVAFNFEGGNPAKLKTETALKYESGSAEMFCGKTITQQIGDYRPLPSGPVIVIPTTALCEENKIPCPTTKIYPLNAVIEAPLASGEKAQWTDGAGMSVECSQSQLAGKTTTTIGVLGELIPTFSECGSCEVELRHLNANGKYLMRITILGVKGKGEMVLDDMSVRILCRDGMGNLTVNCIYGLSKAPLKTIVGAAPNATLFVSTVFDLEAGTCGAHATWTGNYVFAKPKPLWIVP
jgi:hypothetical protein